MRRVFLVHFLTVFLLLWAAPAALRGQEFKGVGQQATAFFHLRPGVAVFEFVNEGQGGPFSATLMDDNGVVVWEMQHDGAPSESSSPANILRGGQYVFNVIATGPWAIRLLGQGGELQGSGAFLSGEEAGRSAADDLPSRGWFLRGLAGGMVAGPIGMGVVLRMASGSDSPEAAASTADPDYLAGFRSAFGERIHGRRKGAVILGGMVGTGVLLAVLVATQDFSGSGDSSGGTPPPGGVVFIRIPG